MIDKTEEVREAVSALLAETFRSGVFNSGELAAEIARAALSVIQEDMVIVPREATPAMVRAAANVLNEHGDDDEEAERVWDAMLSVVE